VRVIGVFISVAALTTAAGLAGCSGGTQPLQPVPAAVRSAQTNNEQAARSWIQPDAAKGNLLYVSSPGNSAVYILSYPGLRLVGEIGHYGRAEFVFGGCSDAKGNVFLPLEEQGELLEFAHGGTKPISTLMTPQGSAPFSCAYDATTGNLAVTVSSPSGDSVAVYANEQGTPTVYQDLAIKDTPWCGYDGHGNLFVDGLDSGFNFALSELPSGGTTFSPLTVNRNVTIAGNVQWDGKYITITQGGSGPGEIYRLSVSGSTADVVGTTPLDGGGGAFGSLIDGSHVILADQPHNELQIYAYPAGGDVIRDVPLYQASFAILSRASKE
jgi:hypothetical protein